MKQKKEIKQINEQIKQEKKQKKAARTQNNFFSKADREMVDEEVGLPSLKKKAFLSDDEDNIGFYGLEHTKGNATDRLRSVNNIFSHEEEEALSRQMRLSKKKSIEHKEIE